MPKSKYTALVSFLHDLAVVGAKLLIQYKTNFACVVLSDHVDDPSGGYTSSRLTGWKLFVVIILGILGVTVCGMVGYVIFAKRAEDARKRFY